MHPKYITIYHVSLCAVTLIYMRGAMEVAGKCVMSRWNEIRSEIGREVRGSRI